MIIELSITEYDYDNMRYIIRHRDIFHKLIEKYSTLAIQYPDFCDEDIYNIPTSFVLHCSFDCQKNIILIDQEKLSPQGKFVLLYLQTLELIQICVDIYNEFERV